MTRLKCVKLFLLSTFIEGSQQLIDSPCVHFKNLCGCRGCIKDFRYSCNCISYNLESDVQVQLIEQYFFTSNEHSQNMCLWENMQSSKLCTYSSPLMGSTEHRTLMFYVYSQTCVKRPYKTKHILAFQTGGCLMLIAA